MATTLSLCHWLAAGVVTTAGAAVASGKCRFYAPGTLTPVNVYSDDAGSSAITQPLTLSAGGRSTVYTLDPVRCIIKDSTDTTTLFDTTLNLTRDDAIYVTSAAFNGGAETTQEAINDAAATSLGGTDWKYKNSATATERTLKAWMGEVHVSVKDYGAVGDDANDDTAEIQAAIAVVVAAGGGIVYFPPGTYRISAALTCSASGVSFIGAGPSVSIIKNTAGAGVALDFTATPITGYRIEQIGFSHSTSSTAAAISLDTPTNVVIDAVTISGHRTGIAVADAGGVASTLRILNSRITTETNAAARAINFTTVSSSSMQGSVIANCRLSAPSGSIIELAGTVRGVSIYGNMLVSASIGLSLNTVTGSGISMFGNDLASVTTGISVTGTAPTFKQWANSLDSNAISLVSGGTASPVWTTGQEITITGTTTGSAYTVAAPAPTPASAARELYITVHFVNAAGGAITGWTVNAIYHTSAGPSTTDTEITSYVFAWTGTVWRQVTRSVTT